MDEMRDRLIAVLKTAKDEIIDLDLKGLADKLIAAGVILPKFSKGNFWVKQGNEVREAEVYEIIPQTTYYGVQDVYRRLCFNVSEDELFATEAEARAALLKNEEN